MQAGRDISTAVAGEAFDRDFMGSGEIIVRREGNSRARHLFTVDGRVIARLRWRGLRRAVYEIEGQRFEIRVGPLDRVISLIAEDGSRSALVHRSRANPNAAELLVEMAEGDNFCVTRKPDSRMRAETSLSVHKKFYASTLLVFQFNTRRRTQTTVRVNVRPVMKWEARFIHRLLALVVCRIILERRHSGSRPLRVKEKPRGFVPSLRVRDRKRLG